MVFFFFTYNLFNILKNLSYTHVLFFFIVYQKKKKKTPCHISIPTHPLMSTHTDNKLKYLKKKKHITSKSIDQWQAVITIVIVAREEEETKN